LILSITAQKKDISDPDIIHDLRAAWAIRRTSIISTY